MSKKKDLATRAQMKGMSSTKLALSENEFRALWNNAIFSMPWNNANFSTTGDTKILHDFFGRLMEREQLDLGAHWLISCAFFCGACKRHPPKMPEHLAVEKHGAELKEISAMIEKIKASPFSFVLNPQADEVVSLANRLPTDGELVAKLTQPLLESRDAKGFIAGLILRDQIPTTKAKNHTESFFADVLAGWFRKTQNKPRWDLVLEIIAMCFHGGEHKWKRAKVLEDSCRKYRAKFKRWRGAVRAWHLATAKCRAVSLPA